MTNAPPVTILVTDAPVAATAPRLHGRWLVVARIGWVAAVLSVSVYYATSVPSFHAFMRLTPAAVQTLHQFGLSADAFAWYFIGVQLLDVLGWCAMGAVLFWRASANRVALLVSFTLILFSTHFYGLPPEVPPGWPALPADGLVFLGAVCFGLFFCVFPSGRFVPRWTPWLLLVWSADIAYFTFFPDAPFVRTLLHFAVSVCLTTGLVAAQVYRYRSVSTPVQRQQTKWAVLGTVLGVVGYLAAFLVFVVLPPSLIHFSQGADDLGYATSTLLTLFIPLGLGIAALRHRLFDIDVIIRRTLLYGSLTVILAAVYFGVVLGLQALVTAVTHQTHPQPIIIVASTLLIVVLANPLRRQVQGAIDRRFYRHRYDARRTLQAFAATLRAETDLRELSEQLVAVVRETMHPASLSLWLRESSKTPSNERTIGSD